MNILVINAGSSSLKYQLFDMTDTTVLAKGNCERIGIDGRVKHTAKGRPVYERDIPLGDHAAAIRTLTELLTSEDYGCLKDIHEIGAVGHRVVHGGELFPRSARIDAAVVKGIEECVPLAPLHNPASLTGIGAVCDVLGEIPQVAVFDTSFHQTIPPESYLYALPYEYYSEHRVRRYGFHGTSHRYVSCEAAKLLGRPASELKIVTCHLGNGSSITAVEGGRSVFTSMGFTPLAGVPMGTRCGDIDPAIIAYLCERLKKSAAEITDIMNKKSGMLGISGVSSDFRDLHEAADSGNERAACALEMFASSVKRCVGSYAAHMGGIDALVFTAGIGENNARMRSKICSGLEFMGLKLDEARNAERGVTGDVTAAGSRGRVYVIPTNEELVIAQDTMELIRT